MNQFEKETKQDELLADLVKDQIDFSDLEDSELEDGSDSL